MDCGETAGIADSVLKIFKTFMERTTITGMLGVGRRSIKIYITVEEKPDFLM